MQVKKNGFNFFAFWQPLIDSVEPLLDHWRVVGFFGFIGSLVFSLLFCPFDSLLREDAFVYLLKSREILSGNFKPVLTQAVGWPMMLAPFLGMTKNWSLVDQMDIARCASVLLTATGAFPLAFLAFQWLKGRLGACMLMLLWVFSFPATTMAVSALSEPLMVLVILSAIAMIVYALSDSRYWIWSALIMGFGFWVRPNGLVAGGIWAALAIWSWKKYGCDFKCRRNMAAGFFVLVIMAAGNWGLRANYFGSGFDYGDNSKLLVDSYEQVWAPNVAGPSLGEYLTNHSGMQIFKKFIVGGVLKILGHALFYVASPVLAFFLLAGIGALSGGAALSFCGVWAGFWLGGLVPVYDVFGSFRHLLPVLPAFLIVSAAGVENLLADHRFAKKLAMAFVGVYALFSATLLIQWKSQQIPLSQVDLQWAQWAAQNLEGKVALIEGADLLMMHRPDATAAGGSQFSMESPSRRLSTTRPGMFERLDGALAWFQEEGVSAIVLDRDYLYRRPYLIDLYLKSKELPFVREIYDQRKIRILAFDWKNFK